MKGHIFNLLCDFIEESGGIQSLENVLSLCSFETQEGFLNTVTYPDEQLYEIVGHTVGLLGISHREAHLAFGEWILPHLINIVPEYADTNLHPSDLLEALDNIHKVELKKLYPDATPPVFNYTVKDKTNAILTYHSSRGLYDLVEGCLHGVASFYQTDIKIKKKMTPDNSSCEYYLAYSS